MILFDNFVNLCAFYMFYHSFLFLLLQAGVPILYC